ncbi:MAG: hypothetical protein Q9181_003100 [Wetmoreana brouardii]
MHCCVRADKSYLRAEDPDQSCKEGAVPIPSVIKSCKNIMCTRMFAKDPKGHDNGDESEDVEYQDETFDVRLYPSQPLEIPYYIDDISAIETTAKPKPKKVKI